jgi:hypothetical protein
MACACAAALPLAVIAETPDGLALAGSAWNPAIAIVMTAAIPSLAVHSGKPIAASASPADYVRRPYSKPPPVSHELPTVRCGNSRFISSL